MRGLQWLGAAVAFFASILLTRIVLHSYTDHGHLDIFHLIIALGAAAVGVVIVFRLLRSRHIA